MNAKLKAVLAAEDKAEDNGLHANDRKTCHTCQTWATPEHRDSAEHKAAIGIHPDFVYDEREGIYRSPTRGRGRPPIGERIHFNLDLPTLARVDHIVAADGGARARLLRDLVTEALDARKAAGL